jgi:hypothetical protein
MNLHLENFRPLIGFKGTKDGACGQMEVQNKLSLSAFNGNRT